MEGALSLSCRVGDEHVLQFAIKMSLRPAMYWMAFGNDMAGIIVRKILCQEREGGIKDGI